MQTKLVALVLLCAAPLTNAHLIDLTPGGFDADQGLPPPFFKLALQTFFDEATPNSWVSKFGKINGGEFFFTDLFNSKATPNANIWWNFTGQQDGYWLTMINVFGRKDDGTAWEHIYGVDGRERFVSDMHELVTLDGLATILSISFYGSNTIPETGEALLLFGAAVALILFISRRNGRAAN